MCLERLYQRQEKKLDTLNLFEIVLNETIFCDKHNIVHGN